MNRRERRRGSCRAVRLPLAPGRCAEEGNEGPKIQYILAGLQKYSLGGVKMRFFRMYIGEGQMCSVSLTHGKLGEFGGMHLLDFF